ncbi:MAG TPA: hypothetical protein VF267_02450 [Gammaproteobacteria bacterium]
MMSRFDKTPRARGLDAAYTPAMLRATPIPPLLAFTVFLALFLAGCSKGVDWPARERENAAHIQASLRATSEAAAIVNAIRAETDFDIRRERLLQTLRVAHLNAAVVEDSVLDKLHPQLYAKFRLDYQRALAGMIRACENGNLQAMQDAANDVQDFVDWYRGKSHTFRWWESAMPR